MIENHKYMFPKRSKIKTKKKLNWNGVGGCSHNLGYNINWCSKNHMTVYVPGGIISGPEVMSSTYQGPHSK